MSELRQERKSATLNSVVVQFKGGPCGSWAEAFDSIDEALDATLDSGAAWLHAIELHDHRPPTLIDDAFHDSLIDLKNGRLQVCREQAAHDSGTRRMSKV